MPAPKKRGRPSKAEIAARDAQLLAQATDALSPEGKAKMVAKLSELADDIYEHAKANVKKLSPQASIVSYAIIHDKIYKDQQQPTSVTHQTNIQINGVDRGDVATLAQRLATGRPLQSAMPPALDRPVGPLEPITVDLPADTVVPEPPKA